MNMRNTAVHSLQRAAALLRNAERGSAAFVKASSALNEAYCNAYDVLGTTKMSALHRDQIVDYLREHCTFDQVLPPTEVTPEELEPGIEDDTLYCRLWFRPETTAYYSSFEATPREVREIFIPRLHMGFYMLQTPTYVFNEFSLMAYPFPVTEQVEDAIGLDIEEAVDWTMLTSLEAAIQASRADQANVIRGTLAQADITAAGARASDGVANVYRGTLQREDVVLLGKHFAGSRSKIHSVVVPEVNWLDWNNLTSADLGDTLAGKVFLDGYEYDRVVGVKFIRTIKCDVSRGDLFREGNIYAFAAPEEVGRSRTLRGLKLYAERRRQFIELDALMARGHIWAVTKKVAKLELYNGGVGVDVGVLPYDTVTAAATRMPLFAVGVPGSDAIWQAPEFILERDTYAIDQAYHRPSVVFV